MNLKSILRTHLAVVMEEVDREGRYRLAASRAGIVGAILMFLGCYLYGIITWGIVPTILIGWLPCCLIAWAAANLLVPLYRPIFRLFAIAFRCIALARPVAAHRI